MHDPIEEYERCEALFAQVVEELGGQSDVYRIAPGILGQLLQFFRFDHGFIYEMDHAGKMHRRAHAGVDAIAMATPFSLEEFFPPETLGRLDHTPFYLHEGVPSPGHDHLRGLLPYFNLKACLIVPFAGEDGKLLGVVGMGSTSTMPVLGPENLARARSLLMVVASHVKMRVYHRHLEHTKQSLSTTLDNTGVKIYVSDFHTQEILYVNEALAAPYGGAARLLGRKCYEALFNNQYDICEHCPRKRLLDADGNPTRQHSWDYRRPGDGAWFHVLSAAFKWMDGRTAHVVSALDITVRKKYESQLEEHELALTEALGKAEEATRMKSSFLANMSHEIRTPMNAIIGMSEMILRSVEEPEIREYTLGIKQAGNHLLSIINDILDISKIESGRLELAETRYSFASLINDVISIIRVRVMEKPIIFTANVDGRIPGQLIGDTLRVRQVLLNVLGNAVKYTDEGVISLRVGCENGDDAESVRLIIDVIDTGSGIPEEDIPILFDAFTQVERNTRHGVEGTGLGLAITRNLCLAMKGEITVSSKYGSGSTFTIVLPQRFADGTPLAAVRLPEQKSILLFEPEPHSAASVAETCHNLGVRCITARTPVEFAAFMPELEKRGIRHILVSDRVLAEAEPFLRDVDESVQVAVMTEYGENQAGSNHACLSFPVYAITLAALLNGTRRRSDTQAVAHMFVAPEAKILITDDIATNLVVAAGLMKPYGMRVDTCRSGRETLERLAETRYDIVFIDHMMPEMDGVETAAHIRRMESGDGYFRDLPLVALTANVAFGAREMFLRNGMSDFLAKPIEMRRLNDILDAWIPDAKKKPVTMTLPSGDSCRLPHIKGLDVARGLQRAGGVPEAYLSVLKTFHDESADAGSDIAASLREQNIDLFTRHMHSLKGATGSIGAGELFRQAQALERAGNLKDIPFIRANAETLLSTLARVRKHIGAFMEAALCGKKTPEPESLRDNLLLLRQAVETYDLHRADKLLAAVISGCGAGSLREQLEAVGDDIVLSSFDAAKAKIDRLLTAQG